MRCVLSDVLVDWCACAFVSLCRVVCVRVGVYLQAVLLCAGPAWSHAREKDMEKETRV